MTRNSVATSRSSRCISSTSARKASTMSARTTSYKSTRCSVISRSNRSKGPSKTSVWTLYPTLSEVTGHGACGVGYPMAKEFPALGLRPVSCTRWSGCSLGCSRPARRMSATISAHFASGSRTSTPPTRFSASSTCTPSPSSRTRLSVRGRTLETASWLFASGLDPEICIVFAQSHVPEHTGLTWLLECTATFGELRRMTQFKEKSKGNESVSVGLFTYPVLMAADILLYDTDKVPVGDDQRQHVELARDLAVRFNGRYGETFVVPEAAVPTVAARVMDLQHPDRKMSKSVTSPLGTIDLIDEPDTIRQKIRKAVTDTDGEVRYDPEKKPGLSNLLELFAAASRPLDRGRHLLVRPLRALEGRPRRDARRGAHPVRERYEEITADPGEVPRLLEKGALKASADRLGDPATGPRRNRAPRPVAGATAGRRGLRDPEAKDSGTSEHQVQVPVLDVAEDPGQEVLVQEDHEEHDNHEAHPHPVVRGQRRDRQ